MILALLLVSAINVARRQLVRRAAGALPVAGCAADADARLPGDDAAHRRRWGWSSTSFPTRRRGFATCGWAPSSPVLLWRLAFDGFAWYVEDQPAHQIHRSIAAVVVFLLWVYVSSIILMYGVEFTAGYARLRRRRPEEMPAAPSPERVLLASHAGAGWAQSLECLIASPPKPARICSSTRTTRSTGTHGARRRSSGRAARTSRSSCRSATRPATGATSWSTRASRAPTSRTVLNRDFVSIKVDREERPDVDRVYMTFVQATTGSGGWPMSVWLTPDAAAVLRRHLLSADRRSGSGPASSTCCRRLRASGSTSATRCCSPRQPSSNGCGAMRAGADAAGARPGVEVLDRAVARVRGDVRCAARRLRQRAEVSAAERTALSAARARADGRRPSRATWRSSRCGRWRSAACAITSAAASIATRWTATGACRTSRRCSTTRRSWCWRTSRRRR